MITMFLEFCLKSNLMLPSKKISIAITIMSIEKAILRIDSGIEVNCTS